MNLPPLPPLTGYDLGIHCGERVGPMIPAAGLAADWSAVEGKPAFPAGGTPDDMSPEQAERASRRLFAARTRGELSADEEQTMQRILVAR